MVLTQVTHGMLCGLTGGNSGEIYYICYDMYDNLNNLIPKGYYRCIKSFSPQSVVAVMNNTNYIVSLGSSYMIPSVTVKGMTTDEDATDDDGKSGIERYEFGISSDGSTWTWNNVTAVEGQEASYTYSDLLNGSTYYFKINAVDKATNSTSSTTNTITVRSVINYDLNGGMGSAPTQTVVNTDLGNSYVQITSTKPSRDGYIFLGWGYESEKGTLARFKSGSSQNVAYFGLYAGTKASSYTLYAVWQPKEITLMSNNNAFDNKWNLVAQNEGTAYGTVSWSSAGAGLESTIHSNRCWVNSSSAIKVDDFDSVKVDYSLSTEVGAKGLFRFYLFNSLPTKDNITSVTAKMQEGDNTAQNGFSTYWSSGQQTKTLDTSNISGSYYITALIFQMDNSASKKFTAYVHHIKATINSDYDGGTVIGY